MNPAYLSTPTRRRALDNLLAKVAIHSSTEAVNQSWAHILVRAALGSSGFIRGRVFLEAKKAFNDEAISGMLA